MRLWAALPIVGLGLFAAGGCLQQDKQRQTMATEAIEYPYASFAGGVAYGYTEFVGLIEGARYEFRSGNTDVADNLYRRALSTSFHEAPNYELWGEYSFFLWSTLSMTEARAYYRAYQHAFRMMSGESNCQSVKYENSDVRGIVHPVMCAEDVDGYVFGPKGEGWPAQRSRMSDELSLLAGLLASYDTSISSYDAGDLSEWRTGKISRKLRIIEPDSSMLATAEALANLYRQRPYFEGFAEAVLDKVLVDKAASETTYAFFVRHVSDIWVVFVVDGRGRLVKNFVLSRFSRYEN